MKQYKYHCINCNHDWEEEVEEEYKNAPCVMPCPKCGEYFVNRVRSMSERGCENVVNNYTSTKYKL